MTDTDRRLLRPDQLKSIENEMERTCSRNQYRQTRRLLDHIDALQERLNGAVAAAAPEPEPEASRIFAKLGQRHDYAVTPTRKPGLRVPVEVRNIKSDKPSE